MLCFFIVMYTYCDSYYGKKSIYYMSPTNHISQFLGSNKKEAAPICHNILCKLSKS